MTPLRLLSRGLLAALVLLSLIGLPLAPARAERIGPGHPSSAGFSGYTTRAGHELGIARVPGGPPGICLDTGTRRWPTRAARPVLVSDPVVGYLLSTRLDAARRDAVLAAALWWSIGRVRGLNSQPGAMVTRLAEVRRESPAVHARILRTSRALLLDAARHAPSATGYAARRPLLAAEGAAGTLSGLGLRSSRGAWVPGIVVRITLTGATFADGSSTRTLRTGAGAPAALTWRRSGNAAVGVRVRYEQVPAHHYLRHALGARYQRVAASAGRRVMTTSATAPALRTPRLTTRVNRQRALVGDVLEDAVSVTGTGGARVRGEWALLGPVPPDRRQRCAEARWSGAAVAGRGAFEVAGDGVVRVGRTLLRRAGCYTYRERLLPSTRSAGAAWTPAGLVEETALATLLTPTLTTRVNRQRSRVGDTLVDAVTVRGAQRVPHTGQWLLLGPVAPDARRRCTGARWAGAPVAARGSFTVAGDGTVQVGRTRLRRGGCYTYRERLLPSPRSTGAAWTAAGLVEETSLAAPRQAPVPRHPSVDTGGRRSTPARHGRGARQARVVVPTAGVGATLESVAFRGSTLPAPHERRRAGLWDGSAPLSSLVGTTLLAGHVSDDHDRPGAFHGLTRARVGQRITTADASGAIRHWRIVRVRAVDRRHLPRSLFLQDIARRLVLITCTDRVDRPGGGFHYRKNLIVEAVPQ